MKITDYEIAKAGSTEDLVRVVKVAVLEGWDVLGVPFGESVRGDMCQAMVKRFNPHEGEVWVKEPGVRGRWEKVKAG